MTISQTPYCSQCETRNQGAYAMTLNEQIEAHIDDLRYSTAKGIAEHFISHGTKGRIASAPDCPVSEWLKSLFPGMEFWTCELYIDFGNVTHHYKTVDIQGTGLSKFIRFFDAGNYPELVKVSE